MPASTAEQDSALIDRIRRGETRLYGVLVERHQDRAYTFALRLLDRADDAEEAVQDAFIRAFNGLAGFRGDSRFSTWLTRILYNVCMSRRSRRREHHTSLDELPERERERVEGADPDPSPLERLEEGELAQAVETAVARLPERYSAVVGLFYLQDLPYEEVARVLDLPVGTVKTHLFRARSLIRADVERSLKERVPA